MQLRFVVTAAAAIALAACQQEPGEPAMPADARVEETQPARTGTVGGPNQGVVAEYQRRIADYMTLQDQLEGTLDDLPDEATPQQIDARQRTLAALIAKARADAKPGLVFSPDMQEFIRGVVRRVLDGPDGKELRASISDENPAGTPVQVNGRYPDSVPMSTMPPDILAALPRLPEELQYRFVGSRLILLDTKAHIIVDYVDSALPA